MSSISTKNNSAKRFGGAFAFLALVTLAFVIGTIWAVVNNYHNYVVDQKIIEEGTKTTAVVTDSLPNTYSCGRVTCTNYLVYYSFTDNQGKIHQTRYTFQKSQSIGESIVVYYLPSDPSQQVPVTEATTLNDILMRLAVLVPIDLFVAWLTYAIWKQFMAAFRKQTSIAG